ncbi:thioredoxin, partial [Candidatus Peregrinibacteria bacterium]|nr:thioredoxin [Candidatus Peregrinibacteria bacterium]
FATWCGPCKFLSPVVEEVAKEYNGKLKVVKVDVDKAGEAATQFGVMSVPTVVFIKDGKEVGRSVGAVPKQNLVKELERIGVK